MKFLKSARKVVTPIRNAIDNLNLTINKHFDQINSIPQELISVIGLRIGNNSSSTSLSQCTLTIAGMIIYNCKKGTQMHEKPHESVSINQLTKRETPIITYVSKIVFVYSQ